MISFELKSWIDKMNERKNFKDSAVSIEMQLKGLGRPVVELLLPPLTSDDLRLQTTARNIEPTKSLLDLYTWHNGTDGSEDNRMDDLYFVPGYMFLPLNESLGAYEALCTELDFWKPDWVPFFSTGGGDYIALECSEAGRIIEYLQGVEPTVLYPTLEAMFQTIDECLKRGAYFVDDDGYFEVEFAMEREIRQEVIAGTKA